MAPNLFNKQISPKKPLKYALSQIYGININSAKEITSNLCLNENKRIGAIKNTQIKKLVKYITKKYKVGGLLKKQVTENIKKKIQIRSYQGIRHKKNLPVRGQRTHTNAQTQKRKKKNK